MFYFILVAIILCPLFFVALIDNVTRTPSEPDFFIGVEYAICNSSVEGCKALIDRVKNFTNLFVVDSLGITLDMNNLNEVCDHVYDAGLYFFVFFISLHEEEISVNLQGEQVTQNVLRYNYYPHIWISDAKKKYGKKFLGAYTMDEPGGNQLDSGLFQLVENSKNQNEAAELFVKLLHDNIEYYLHAKEYEDITVLTSDYGLYWYDYKAEYDTVLVEFAWNHSRILNVALCRGAANIHKRDWGVMVTWTYNRPPYIVSGNVLYEDLITAYHNGAKFVVIFNHPDTNYSNYGILTEEHFEALKKFWNYVNDNPNTQGKINGSAVYVLPENFGFGFRNPKDTIWGLWSADTDSRVEKIWSDINQLLDKYGFVLDIIYSDPEFDALLTEQYDEVFFWDSPIS